MNLAEKREVIIVANRRRNRISDEKGSEYSGGGEDYGEENVDVLANFKHNAELLGITPLEIAAIYFGKHVDSFFTFVRGYGRTYSIEGRRNLLARGEGFVSRLDDIRNYADLIECLLYEELADPEQGLREDWDNVA